jgi:hypothetical protein
MQACEIQPFPRKRHAHEIHAYEIRTPCEVRLPSWHSVRGGGVTTNQVTRPKDNVLEYRNSDSEVLEQYGRYIASRYLEIINYYNLGEGFEHGPQRARVSVSSSDASPAGHFRRLQKADLSCQSCCARSAVFAHQ